MPSFPRLNCHTHIFNLEAVKTPWALDILKKRLVYDHGETLGKVLGEVAVALVEGIPRLNEESLLRRLLEAFGVDAQLPGELEEPVLRWLRRRVDRALERLRRDPDSDFRDDDLHDILETLRIVALPSIARVSEWLLGQVGPEDAVVPLMMDLTDGKADVTDLGPGEQSRFRRQLEDTSAAVLAHPGRVLPFVAVHPARPDFFEQMQEALEQRGFVGVKLYPSLGYETDTPEMRRVYEHCAPRGIPLLMHTNLGGFVGAEGANFFPDPETWRTSILPDFPELHICFAHFGGGGKLTQPFSPASDDPTVLKDDPERGPELNWSRKILELMRDPRFPGVWADVSFHRIAMDSEENTRNYFARIAALLEIEDIGRSILFGTDFWLIRPRLRESSHWRFFEENTSGAHFSQMAVENPARFLGLDTSDGRRNEALEAHVRFIVENEAQLGARPTPWLLEAIEAAHGAATRQRIEERTENLRPQRRLLGERWPEALLDAEGKSVVDDFKKTYEISLGRLETDVLGVPVGFSGEGEIKIETFHEEDQADEDAILLPPPVDARFGDFERRRVSGPQGTPIAFRDDRAWLKYRLTGRLRADAQAATGLVNLGVVAEKEVVFADYRAHPRSVSLATAIASDLRRPRFALSRSDVLQMRDGDALSFATRGRLGGELTLSFYDVFTSGLDQLAAVLGARAPLRLRVDLGLTLSARLEIEDDFRISFARRNETLRVGDGERRIERVRVAARKLEARGRAAKVALRAGVQFDDQAAVEAALEQLLEQGVEQGVAADVEALRDKLEATVKEIARARLEAGFTYHYNRLETDAVLLEADLSEDALEQLHHELVDGDLSGVLERHRRGDVENVDLHQFLRFREVVRRQSWGFQLGPVGGQDFVEKRFREHVRIVDEGVGEDGGIVENDGIAESDDAPARKLSFLGQRGYEGRWARLSGERTRWRWRGDFRAEMGDFERQPRAAHFDYGLALVIEWEDRLFKKSLGEWLDAAQVWGAVADDLDVDRVWAHLSELQRHDVLARLELVFNPATFRALLPTAAKAGAARRGAALAAAMPLHDGQARDFVHARRQAFADLWKDFLDSEAEATVGLGSGDRARFWGRIAAQRLERAGLHHAARAERLGPDSGSNDRWFLWTFGGLLFLDGSPFGELESFHRGLERLRQALHPEPGAAPPREEAEAEVEAIFQDLEPLFKQTHYVRAAGALLVDAARRADVTGRSSLTLRRVDETAGTEEIVGIAGTP